MTVVKIKNDYFYYSAVEFINDWEQEKEFEDLTGIKFEDWETGVEYTDMEIIETLLDEMPKQYVVIYDDVLEGIKIYEV